MGGTDVLEVLNHQFPGVIRNYQVCYENEFCCEVDPGEIGRIARLPFIIYLPFAQRINYGSLKP